MNFKYISQWKVCIITFQNLDLESWKVVFNFDLSPIWEILEFGTNVLSCIQSQIFKQKIGGFSQCVATKYISGDFRIPTAQLTMGNTESITIGDTSDKAGNRSRKILSKFEKMHCQKSHTTGEEEHTVKKTQILSEKINFQKKMTKLWIWIFVPET